VGFAIASFPAYWLLYTHIWAVLGDE